MIVGIIYIIVCVANGYIYIGSTEQTLLQRWSKHKYASTTVKYWNLPMYQDMRLYGEDAFSYRAIEIAQFENVAALKRQEGKVTQRYKNMGYNVYNKNIAGRTRAETIRAYKEKNRHILLAPTLCNVSNCTITKKNLLRHLRSPKHRVNLLAAWPAAPAVEA
jgi:predicted GIY-YIG superfamily endonuclease